jgi:hypothetical protein
VSGSPDILAPPLERGASHYIEAHTEGCHVGLSSGATITWDADKGDLALTLVDARGKVLATGHGKGRVNLVVGSLCGDFLISIRVLRGDQIPYALHIQAPGAGPS